MGVGEEASGTATTERRFGRFLLRAELGAGAMGTVHRAWDPETGSEVALKVLALPLAAFPEAERRELLRRFEREALLAGRLDHPGVARVRGAGEADGVPWIAMDLVAGETFAALIRRRRREPEFLRDAVEIVAQAAEALHCAHERGVVHRDVKPANVLVESASGRARVTDFGLAREVAPGSRLTQDGQVIGTPQYMAPEQARGDLDAIDAQTDVYGLGATLYEALTGRPPFQGDVAWKVALEVIRGTPEPPREVDPSIPEPLEAIVKCAMAHKKEGRYASAREMAQELRAWLTKDGSVRGRPRVPRGPTLGYLARLLLKQHRTAACVGAVALALMVAGTAFFLWRLGVLRERAERRAEVARATLDVMVYEVRDQLADLPGDRVRDVRRRLLESAIAGIEDLRQAVAKDAPASVAAAEAQRQVGELLLAAGLPERADEAFRTALEVSRRAALEDPSSVEPRLDVVESLAAIGRARRERGEPLSAIEAFREAEASLRALRAEAAAGRATAGGGSIYAYWAYFVSDGEGAGGADEAILGALVETTGELGATLLEIGDAGALETCREAVALAREAVALRPGSAAARRKLAASLERLSSAYGGGLAGGLAEAEEAARLVRAPSPESEPASDKEDGSAGTAADPGAAEGARERLARGRAASGGALARERGRDLVAALLRLAEVRRTGGDAAGGLAATDEATALARGLLAADPTSVRARADLAAALEERSRALEASGDLDGAVAAAGEAISGLDELLAQDPGHPPARRALARSLARLGEARLSRGEAAEARAALERSLALVEGLLAADPSGTGAKRERARALAALAEALEALRETDAAEARRRAAVEEMAAVVARAPWHRPALARLEADLAAATRTGHLLAGEVSPEGAADQLLLASTFSKRGEWARAAERYQAALADEGARADLPRDALYRAACAAARAAQATAGKEAQGWRERALRWLADDVTLRAAREGARSRALAAHLARITAEPAFAGMRGTAELGEALRAGRR